MKSVTLLGKYLIVFKFSSEDIFVCTNECNKISILFFYNKLLFSKDKDMEENVMFHAWEDTIFS